MSNLFLLLNFKGCSAWDKWCSTFVGKFLYVLIKSAILWKLYLLHVRKSGTFNLFILKWSMFFTCCIICDLHTCNVVYIQKLFSYFSCRLNFQLCVYHMQHYEWPEWDILIFKFRIVECGEEENGTEHQKDVWCLWIMYRRWKMCRRWKIYRRWKMLESLLLKTTSVAL